VIVDHRRVGSGQPFAAQFGALANDVAAVGVNEIDEGAAQQLIGGVGAEHRQGAGIDEHEAAIALDEDAKGRELDQLTVAFFAQVQGALGCRTGLQLAAQLGRALADLAADERVAAGTAEGGEHREQCDERGKTEEETLLAGRAG